MPFPKRGKHVLSWAVGVAVLAVILLLTVVPSTMQQASATGTPGLFGSLQSYMWNQSVTIRNGMTWIEAKDPRSRKGDKVRPANR